MTTGSNTVCIDVAVLNENTMSNAELQRELFDLFFAQAPVYVDGLAAAMRLADRAAWKASAHGLKGSSRSLGFKWLSELSEEAEETGPNVRVMRQISEAVDATQQEVLALVA